MTKFNRNTKVRAKVATTVAPRLAKPVRARLAAGPRPRPLHRSRLTKAKAA